MAIQLFLHRAPAPANDDFANSEPSVLSSICRGFNMFMHGWYPTQDIPEQRQGMGEREILVFTPLGLSAHYWTFSYIAAAHSPRREASHPTYQNASNLIHRHERSLAKDAGARSFYDRVVAGYLATLQSKEQLDHFESFDGESFVALFKQIIRQVVMSNKPLQTDGEPTDELPLGLHSIIDELERIRKIKEPEKQQTAIEAAASRLHQGSPLCVQPLQQAWNRCLQSADFTTLKTKLSG